MWEFIKSAPITFIIVGIVLLLAVVGVVVGVVLKGRWEDRGLMKRSGKSLQWNRDILPINVIYHPDLSLQWQATFVGAATRFAQAIGRDVFKPIATPPGYNFNNPPPLGAGLVVIWPKEPAEAMQSVANTVHRYNLTTGEIHAATITVPSVLQTRMPVMIHELGHALGLDHDEQPNSIMYPTISHRPSQLSSSDTSLLKKIYGTTYKK